MKFSIHQLIIGILCAIFVSFVIIFSLNPVAENLNIVTGSDKPATAYLININTADAAELETLDGIGKKTAVAIIEHRNTNGDFENADELCDVPGIGPSTLEKIKDFIEV